MLAAFLMNRSMIVKVGKEWSVPKSVNAGAPQGSVLGCYLFNIGVDGLEDGFSQLDQAGGRLVQEHITRSDNFSASSTPLRVGPCSRQPDLSPIREDNDFRIDFLPRIANVPPWLKKPTEKKWTSEPLLTLKFVDDGINAEVINMKEVPLMIENDIPFKETHAEKTGRLLEHFRKNAEEKGLVINEKRQSYLCVCSKNLPG